MNTPQSTRTFAALAAAIFVQAPAARATWVTAESSNISVETRWVLAESSNIRVDTRDWAYLTITAPHGAVLPLDRQFLPNITVELTATPDPGYLFSEWSGDASGTDNPLSLLLDTNKTLGATFDPDSGDDDSDGLTNYQEIVVYGSKPDVKDSDGDGFPDGYEVSSGYSPTNPDSTPETQMVIYTSVEVRFGAALGQSYRVESSINMQSWTPVEAGIVGTGGTVTRFYSIREIPKRFFRAVRE
jgi:hypothetical protein